MSIPKTSVDATPVSFSNATPHISFHQKIPNIPYESIDLAETENNLSTWLSEFRNKLTDQNALSLLSVYFPSLNINTANWQSFQKLFPDLSADIKMTAFIMADLVLNNQQNFDDTATELKVAQFLATIVTFNGYGINSGSLVRAANLNQCAFQDQLDSTSKAKVLYNKLLLSLKFSIDPSSYQLFAQSGTGACFDLENTGASIRAHAGQGSIVGENETIKLNGSQSYTTSDGYLNYSWEQVGGPEVEWVSQKNIAQPQFKTPTVFKDNPLAFELTIKDRTGIPHTDTVTLTLENNINEPPVVSLEPVDSVEAGEKVTLTALTSDPNQDSLEFQWEEVTNYGIRFNTIEYSKQNQSEVWFIAPSYIKKPTQIKVKVTIDDGHGKENNGQISSEISIHIKPKPIPIELDGYVNNANPYEDTAEEPEVSMSLMSSDDELPYCVTHDCTSQKEQTPSTPTKSEQKPIIKQPTKPIPQKEIAKKTTPTPAPAQQPETVQKPEPTPVSKALAELIDVFYKNKFSKFFQPLKEADPKTQDHQIALMFDLSGSMVDNATQMSQQAENILDNMLAQLPPDASLEISITLYCDNKTIVTLPFLTFNNTDRKTQTEQNSIFEEQLIELNNYFQTMGGGTESLWHSIHSIISGKDRLTWKPNQENKIGQYIYAITDSEMLLDENIVDKWDHDAIQSLLNSQNIKFIPIQFDEPVNTKDILADYIKNSNPSNQNLYDIFTELKTHKLGYSLLEYKLANAIADHLQIHLEPHEARALYKPKRPEPYPHIEETFQFDNPDKTLEILLDTTVDSKSKSYALWKMAGLGLTDQVNHLLENYDKFDSSTKDIKNSLLQVFMWMLPRHPETLNRLIEYAINPKNEYYATLNTLTYHDSSLKEMALCLLENYHKFKDAPYQVKKTLLDSFMYHFPNDPRLYTLLVDTLQNQNSPISLRQAAIQHLADQNKSGAELVIYNEMINPAIKYKCQEALEYMYYKHNNYNAKLLLDESIGISATAISSEDSIEFKIESKVPERFRFRNPYNP